MNRHGRLLATILPVGILFAWGAVCIVCAEPQPTSKEGDRAVGILFGTYTRSLAKEHFRKESLMFRRVGERKVHSVGIKLRPYAKVPIDFEDGKECGRLFYFELPPGDYEFFDCSLTQDTPGGPFTYSADRKFSVRFKVEDGKANYLGSIRISKKMSAYRTPRRGAAEFAFTYQDERDWELMKRMHPEVSLPLNDAFPTGGIVPEYILLIREKAEP